MPEQTETRVHAVVLPEMRRELPVDDFEGISQLEVLLFKFPPDHCRFVIKRTAIDVKLLRSLNSRSTSAS